MTVLQHIKEQLRSHSMDMISDFSKEDTMDKEELMIMFSQVAEVLHDLNKVDSIGKVMEELGKDTYAVIGYCSETEADLMEDVERRMDL